MDTIQLPQQPNGGNGNNGNAVIEIEERVRG